MTSVQAGTECDDEIIDVVNMQYFAEDDGLEEYEYVATREPSAVFPPEGEEERGWDRRKREPERPLLRQLLLSHLSLYSCANLLCEHEARVDPAFYRET
ncbi:hypothetical protein QR680_016229 [Steinernema hermaphroditum]|uniref:Uncharacterized protein n=1 Tax=Steinernema hermaphroditum TaxID=289476 RepID=A0AA39HAH4_9BILA|nr:hypothetical protein QR680_016229 [Steinernema hermaphroditum]